MSNDVRLRGWTTFVNDVRLYPTVSEEGEPLFEVTVDTDVSALGQIVVVVGRSIEVEMVSPEISVSVLGLTEVNTLNQVGVSASAGREVLD